MPDSLSKLVDAALDDFLDNPKPAWLSPAALRLARRVPTIQMALDPIVVRPIDRALAGLSEPLPYSATASLPDRVHNGLAVIDGGGRLLAAHAAAIEADAIGDPQWWVDAARLHVLSSEPRERAARMVLSDQELPYVFPGELHPMMVEVLAVGDRVLTALHVDWMRKLTGWVVDVAVLDVRQLGLWFWPQLRYLSERKLKRPLTKLQRLRRGQPGSLGLVAGYQARVGQDPTAFFDTLDGTDRFIAALAVASDRPVRPGPRTGDSGTVVA
jgi:hypothetical protein